MNRELDRLLLHLEGPDRTVPDVSRWSVYQHLEHAALSARHIAELIRRLGAGKGEPGGRTRPIARLMLLNGWIPRGKGRAPDFAEPHDTPDPDRIRKLIERSRAVLVEAGRLRGRNRFEHPLLGPLTAKQWLRFGRVHTRHHLKIVRDIQRATC